MSRIAALLAVATAALVTAASALPAASVTKLTGTVGPGFTITLKKGSAKVKTLPAGKYAMVVKDKSAIHNFHLIGPGVNKKSAVAKVGTSTWNVTLKKGKYTYVCDPHKSSMRGSFTVK